MRGEKGVHAQGYVRVSGSPPHARGKASENARELIKYRITPACAGKSCGYRIFIR